MLIKTIHCFCSSLLRLRVFKEPLKRLAAFFFLARIYVRGRLETGLALCAYCLAMRIVGISLARRLYATRKAIVGLINYCFIIRHFRIHTHLKISLTINEIQSFSFLKFYLLKSLQIIKIRKN